MDQNQRESEQTSNRGKRGQKQTHTTIYKRVNNYIPIPTQTNFIQIVIANKDRDILDTDTK